MGGGLINSGAEVAWGEPSVALKDRIRVRISDEAPKEMAGEEG